MESGYRILWSSHALSELKETVEYLENNWTEKELRNFAARLDHTMELISKTPEIFPSSLKKEGVRKATVEKHNTLYYRVNKNAIEILSLFSTHQNPDNIKI